MAEVGGIEVLDGIEAVRRRPGMYVGGVDDGSGLHHMLWEVVANALDQHLGGHARRRDVVVQGDEARVSDDGRGIPVHQRPDGRTYLETVLTELHAGATADEHFPHVHIAIDRHGIGLAPVCALSESLRADVKRDGIHYRQEFARGRPTGPLTELGTCNDSGTTIQFVPDSDILIGCRFDEALVTERLQEVAFLNPDLTVTFQGTTLAGGDGLGTYCETLLGTRPPSVEAVLRLRGRHKKVDVDVALAWAQEGNGKVRSYVSQGLTPDGGSHERGFWEGMRRAFKEVDAGGVLNEVSTRAFRSELSQGLSVVIHAGLYHPEFDSPTKSQLRSPEARSAVAHVVQGGLAVYLMQYHRLRESLLSRFGG